MILPILASLAFVSSTPLGGVYQHVNWIGAWELARVPSDHNNCVLIAGYDNGALMTLGFESEAEKLVVLVGSGDWNAENTGAEGAHGSISFSTSDGREDDLDGVAVHINGTNMVMGFVRTPEFISHLKGASQMSVGWSDGHGVPEITDVLLKGSTAAIEALSRCQYAKPKD